MSEIVVRRATLEDEAQILALCHMLHAENGLFNMDDNIVRETVHDALIQKSGVIGVIGPSDALEGVIFLTIGRFWYTREPHLEELFNFVHPDFRRSERSKKLIDYAKMLAGDDIKLVIGVMSGIRTEAKVRLYERRLGPRFGAFFVYNHGSEH